MRPGLLARIRFGLVRRVQGAPGILDVFSPAPPAASDVDPALSVLFVCHGNICRSPMAEGIFRRKLSDRGLLGRVAVASAGVEASAAGRRPDNRARATMRRHGDSIRDLRARRFTPEDFDRFDLILGMDDQNVCTLLGQARDDADRARVGRLLDYAQGGEIGDPIALGPAGFELSHKTIDAATEGLIEYVIGRLGSSPPSTRGAHERSRY